MFNKIEIDPLTARIGAEVRGVDLSRPLDRACRESIREALMQHLVLFFRDQPLTPEEQLAFAAEFGEPQLGSDAPGGSADIARYFVTLENGPDARPRADRWHTDLPFIAAPPDIAVLTMPTPAPVGGDTMWLNLYALYESLSPQFQELLAPLEIEFDMGPSKLAARDLYGDEYYQQLLANEPIARHPLVRVHPVTGRSVAYLGGAFMRGVVGLHSEESDVLLGVLTSKLDDPNLQCRWQWRQHDVAMWDERCTNHRALADYFPSSRTVRRCTVGAGVPAGPPALAAAT